MGKEEDESTEEEEEKYWFFLHAAQEALENQTARAGRKQSRAFCV